MVLANIIPRKRLEKIKISKGKLFSDITSGSSKHVPLTTQFIQGLGVSSAGSAFGALVYGIIERKEKTSALLVDFAKDSGSGIVIGILLNNVPYLGVSIVSILGVFGVTSIFNNKLVKTSTRAKMIAETLAKNGAAIGMSIGGGIIGQMLIPIPIVGAFIGSAIGGFASSAVVGVYDLMTTSKISLETLSLYSLLVLSKNGFWVDYSSKHLFEEDSDHRIAEKFFNITIYVSEINLDSFNKELHKKRKALLQLIESIAVETAPKKLKKKKVVNVEEEFIVWKTTVAFCLICYFYYNMSQAFSGLILNTEFPEEVFLTKISKFQELIEPESTLLYLAQRIDLLEGEESNYFRILSCIQGLIKQRKICNLFKKETKPNKKKLEALKAEEKSKEE